MLRMERASHDDTFDICNSYVIVSKVLITRDVDVTEYRSLEL